MDRIAVAVLISFAVCVVTGPWAIPFLRKLKFGQSILEIGPQWHAKKSGTPTMGGIIFIIGIIIAVMVTVHDLRVFLLLASALSFGVIGFIDDYIKVVLKRNLGLTARQKFTAQTIAAIAYVAMLYYFQLVNTQIYIPYVNIFFELPMWAYMFLSVFVILATVNSVNLTDGLDGLASSITLTVSIFFTFAALLFADVETAIFAATITGGCLGFLLFNAYPAKVFMGDTGSLFLGGAIAAIAISLRNPLILVIVGGVYLVETLSVMIQVASFKITGKRVFKMSPIHHHFEMIGWKETKVVTIFVLVTVLLCVIGYFGIQGVRTLY